mmetsp:Transcript_14678/g.23971  ORF Transcript_14678/g.23971 Transcript_14678/m.23971 type:complete len:111 (-) Transcript_14678:425-757(-)
MDFNFTLTCMIPVTNIDKAAIHMLFWNQQTKPEEPKVSPKRIPKKYREYTMSFLCEEHSLWAPNPINKRVLLPRANVIVIILVNDSHVMVLEGKKFARFLTMPASVGLNN